jgi:hypothetical protein
MTRGQALGLHLATALVGGTGLVYGWMRYLLEPASELSLVHHPREPLLQTLHVLSAPFLVFACGLVWSEHVWQRLRSGQRARRRTGMLLSSLLLPMVLSGYLLQVSTSEWLRELAVWMHAGGSGLWLLGYLVHQCLRARLAAGGPQERGGTSERWPESTAARKRSA